MSEDQLVVASAVVVPEATEPSPQSALKRRQSSISETDSKRPRLSIAATDNHNDKIDSPTTDTPSDPRAARRKSGQIDERKRGQRLFGALLGTLAQSSSSASQRRRADIEKKQQEKLKVQDAQADQKRKARLANLKELRQREQKRFDEQSMRSRHSNMLMMAHFLQTETEPRLYYKPWELRPEEDDRIKSQIADAEATIDQELEEFEAKRGTNKPASEDDGQHRMELDELTPAADTVGSQATADPLKPAQESQDDTNGTAGSREDTTGDEKDTAASVEDRTNTPSAVQSAADIPMDEKDDDTSTHKEGVDEHGDVVLETEEDTVIY